MTEWVDFTVYAGLIVALWVVLPAWSARFTLRYVADRNPEWLAAHPEVAAKLTDGRGFRWAYYGWGTVSLAILLAFQMDVLAPMFGSRAPGTPKWEVLKDVNSILLFPGIVLFGASGILFTRWLNTAVPLAARRQATLTRRSIDDFVPRWIQRLTYAFIALVVLAWIATAVLQWPVTSEFWGRLVALAALSMAFEFFARLAVNRPPHVMDRMFGSKFRVSEVRIGFAMHLLPPVVGLVRLYEQVAGTELVDLNRAMHLGVAMLVTAWALRFVMYYAAIESDRGSKGPSTPIDSAVPAR
jgi:hypothetical protein